MFYMLTIFAILCILAIVAMVFRSPITSEVPTVSPVEQIRQTAGAFALLRADMMEATEVATRASDYARIRAAANRFGGRVPHRTLNAATYVARLAHDIACEPRVAFFEAVGTLDTAEEATRLQRDASAARDDLPGALARFATLQSSPILDEIVTEIVERR